MTIRFVSFGDVFYLSLSVVYSFHLDNGTHFFVNEFSSVRSFLSKNLGTIARMQRLLFCRLLVPVAPRFTATYPLETRRRIQEPSHRSTPPPERVHFFFCFMFNDVVDRENLSHQPLNGFFTQCSRKLITFRRFPQYRFLILSCTATFSCVEPHRSPVSSLS